MSDPVLAAHARGDAGAMARAYAEAAERSEGDGRAFLLTHAWVHALEAGDALAERMERELRAMGRV